MLPYLIRINMAFINQRAIAKKLGISQATVSLAIARDSRIKKQTQDRVISEMDSSGYIPNANARALVRKRTETIGIIILGLKKDEFKTEYFFEDAILTIVKELGKYNYNILLRIEEAEECHKLLNRLAREKRVDGVIILTLVPFDREYITSIEEIGFPFLLINRHLNDHPVNCVVLDDYGATFHAVKYLFEFGHRRIIYLAGDIKCSALSDRNDGFVSAVRKLGLDETICTSIPFFGDDESQFKSYLEKNDFPTAIIAYTDTKALAAAKIMATLGLNNPKDYSLIGYNNRFAAVEDRIPLTTFDYCMEELGVEAVKLILKTIEKKIDSPQRIVISPRFIERDSCRPLPAV
jgi:DNA-binding LacI/PurR family transcriptional regulator